MKNKTICAVYFSAMVAPLFVLATPEKRRNNLRITGFINVRL